MRGSTRAPILASNPDVAEAVASGSLASGDEHWIKFGQYETSREAVYSDRGSVMPTPAPGDDGGETVADMTVDGDASVPTTLSEIEASFEIDLENGVDTSGLMLLDPARLNIEDGVTMTTTQYQAFTSGEGAALTGVSGDGLSMLFGASLTFSA